MTDFYAQPLKLIPNKITRNKCPGGRLINHFRGIMHDDDDCTEAWVGSCSKVNNLSEFADKNTGMSQVNMPDGSIVYVQELIDMDPKMVLGEKHYMRFGNNPNILVKLLDPEKPLPLQAHPTRDRAENAYNSKFGKTECWYILSVRDDMLEKPYILLGFKEGISRELFDELYEMEDIAAMENWCHKVYVQPGDMYYIDGGLAHTIGGCLAVEIQEPSDLIAKVKKNPNYPYGPEAWKELQLGTYIYKGRSYEETLREFCVHSNVLIEDEGGFEQYLIGKDQTPFFSVLRYQVYDNFKPIQTGTFSICIVTEGTGYIRYKDGEIKIKKGDEIFLPAGIEDMQFVCSPEKGKLTLIRCLPPSAV